MPRISKKKQDEMKKRFLKVYLEKHAILTSALRMVKVSKTLYYGWLRDDPIFKSEVDDINEMSIDFVESKLFENIEKGDKISILYYLKTKGAYMGRPEWRERQQIESNVSYTEPLKLVINQPKQIDEGDDKKKLDK